MRDFLHNYNRPTTDYHSELPNPTNRFQINIVPWKAHMGTSPRAGQSPGSAGLGIPDTCEVSVANHDTFLTNAPMKV
jgi:hypothetical protein